MGEWSKKVGDAGENLVNEFLKLIGWSDAQRGITVDCVKPEKHRVAAEQRQTHGLDRLFTYKSPLWDEALFNIVISVKFSASPYPDNPKSQFRLHTADLGSALECFKSSQHRNNTMHGRTGIREVFDFGVLFWLNNAKDSYADLVGRLQKLSLPDEQACRAIHVVDNKRIAFIYDSLMFSRRQFPTAQIGFYYHETGKNINPLTRQHSGHILPLEAITSHVIALRVETTEGHGTTLMLFLDAPFSEASLRRMIGEAHTMSGSWASRILVCFPDFSALNHVNTVQSVKASFEAKAITSIVDVASYAHDFRSLQR